jgi:methylmalonyl-CoA mutase cobalamin-binding subunit
VIDPPLKRSEILPEPELPNADELMAEGRELAKTTPIGPSAFLDDKNVRCEADYKRRQRDEGVIMLHAQIGYRSLEKTRRAYHEVYERLAESGHGIDRFGICLDWSMGYPAERRGDMPWGTGLILESAKDFAALTAEAPAAPHFGDFVIGFPSATENTAAALAAGSTAIGNLGQYFTFRLPYWPDDVETTASTLRALSLAAAQPVPVMIHSNLDDGYAAQFHDMACALGFAEIERYIIEELVGGHVSHCYGHTYAEPLTRLAFQRALAAKTESPGTMVYGNTTIYGPDEVENYARLAGYLLVDILAQRTRPSGHAVNPVPVTEALRIPEIGEVIDAHRFALQLIDRSEKLEPLFDFNAADAIAARIENGAKHFYQSVLTGLKDAGIDIRNPFEMLLALRRLGARTLERKFGPGEQESSGRRRPIVISSTIEGLEGQADQCLLSFSSDELQAIQAAGLSGCLATTDVHEYGKILVAAVLEDLGVRIVDAGVSMDPDVIVRIARERSADFIALSTYSGVALDYIQRLRSVMEDQELAIPVFIGGKLNQVLEDSQDSLPVDVTQELDSAGAIPCQTVEDMVKHLIKIVEKP